MLNFPVEPAEYAEAARAYLPMIPPEDYPHLNGMSREIAAGRHDGVQDVEFGLTLILDELEQRLGARSRMRRRR